MSLFEKQADFFDAFCELGAYAKAQGYRLTFGDAYRDPRVFGHIGEKNGYGSKNSNHKLRLAVDVNLKVDGVYIEDSAHPAWGVLHQYWETHLGGAPMLLDDANHFSYEHNGRI